MKWKPNHYRTTPQPVERSDKGKLTWKTNEHEYTKSQNLKPKKKNIIQKWWHQK